MTSVLRSDLLDSELTVNNQKVKIIVEEVMTSIAQRAVPDRTKTPGVTKDIVEVMELIRIAIKDYEAKNHNADAFRKVHDHFWLPA